MAQISLYVDDATASRLSAAARVRNLSVSKYVSAIVSESLSKDAADEIRKKNLLEELQGVLDDPSLADLPDIPWEAGAPRRFDLI